MNTNNLGKQLLILAAVLVLFGGIYAVWKYKCGENCEKEPVAVTQTTDAPVVIYTTSYCSFCKRAKALLDEKGIAYKEVDVEKDEAMRTKLVELSGGRTTVPQIFIHGQPIGGFTDLEKLNTEGKLEGMIAAAPATTTEPTATEAPAEVPGTPYTADPKPVSDTAPAGVTEGPAAGVVTTEPAPEQAPEPVQEPELPQEPVQEQAPESIPQEAFEEKPDAN